MRINNELGYILHQKPFSETSVLLEVFTPTFGRIALIAKGAKRPKSHFKAYLFPFKLLNFSFVGKNELKTLTHIDEKTNYTYGHANQLIFGLYLNELILRFLKKEDPHPELFAIFHLAMGYLFNLDNLCSKYTLSKNYFSQLILRAIEIELLTSVGYGIDFSTIAQSHLPIIGAEYYEYNPSIGFTKSNCLNTGILGEILILMCKLDLNKLDHFLDKLKQSNTELALFLKLSKNILRQSLDFHLGEKKIYTRELAGIEWGKTGEMI